MFIMELKELAGRKVLFFRTQIEPGITAMPKNAIHSKDVKEIVWFPVGIYVKGPKDREHFVFAANIQTCEFMPEENKT